MFVGIFMEQNLNSNKIHSVTAAVSEIQLE